MPRIYNGDSDPVDFCKRCFPKTEAIAKVKYGEGEGPDERGNCFSYDAEHPSYNETDYKCEICGKDLHECDD